MCGVPGLMGLISPEGLPNMHVIPDCSVVQQD